MTRSKGMRVVWSRGGGRSRSLAPTRCAPLGLGTCLPPGRESAHARRRVGGGPWLPSWRARDSLPGRPLECAVFRSRGIPLRSPAARVAAAPASRPLPAAAMPSVQLPPKESALFKRVLVSGGAATHLTSARFVYLRAGLSRGSPPPRAASAASVPTADAFQKLLGRGAGVPASGRLPSAALVQAPLRGVQAASGQAGHGAPQT